MSLGALKKITEGMWLKLYGLVSFEHWMQLCVPAVTLAVVTTSSLTSTNDTSKITGGKY